MLKKFMQTAAVVAALSFIAMPASALNILLTNDDGFETDNITKLYDALKAAGHDVVIAAPFGEQSGKSSAISILPIGNVEEDSPKGTVKAGASGIGQHPSNPDIHYIDSLPAVAAFYGIDIVAKQRWNAPPELLISGPNEGHNLGYITYYSGTVGAATTALHLGVPAIAVSADRSTGRNPALSEEVAAIVVKIVAQLERNRPDGAAILPENIGFNINIPRFDPGQGAALTFKHTEIGSHAIMGGSARIPLGLRFYMDKREDPVLGKRFKEAAPGLGIDPSRLNPAVESNANAEALHVASKMDENRKVVQPGAVTLSVLESTRSAGGAATDNARQRLAGLAAE